MKKMLMIGVGVVVLLAAAIGGTLFVTGSLGGGHAPEGAPASAVPVAPPAPVVADPVYFPMEPAFTVNIEDGFATRFLQVEINLMYRDTSTGDRLSKVMPHIRNDILMLLSAKTREAISTPEAREALQAELVASINAVLSENTGRGGVEAVYFTKFVVQ